MPEDHTALPTGAIQEAENTPKTGRSDFPREENGMGPGKMEVHNEINALPGQRGSSLYSANGENEETGKMKPRKELSDYEAAGQANRKQVRADIKSSAPLTSLYCVSYGHFKSMHARAKAEGNEVHRSWCGQDGFARFLIDVGPIPQLDRSLDRMKCSDPEYGPGKVRWATPREQANNRKNTLLVYDPNAKERGPLTIVAERLDLSAKAMRRRIERGADPDQVVIAMLADRAKKGKGIPSGKRVLTSPAEQERAGGAFRAEIPPRPVARINIKVDWPASLTGEQRARWNASYREQRQTNENGEYEWRFEFFIRTIRGWLSGAGFGGRLIGHGPAWEGTALEKMRNGWADPESPTDRQLQEYGELEDAYNRMFSRLQAAIDLQPTFAFEASQLRRERDRSYPRYRRGSRASAYHDAEDRAMKDDEAFGHIDADEPEGEVAPAADKWREEMASEWAVRRRGMEL